MYICKLENTTNMQFHFVSTQTSKNYLLKIINSNSKKSNLKKKKKAISQY